MKRLARQLGLHRCHDFRMAVPDVKNTEAAEAVDVLAPLNVPITIWTCVAPFDNGAGAVYFRGFSIFEKTRIYMVAKVFNGFACDPRRLFARDRCCLD